MNSKTFLLMLGIVSSNIYAQSPTKPNLLIIHTDEHNFRTLGCYRNLMDENQAFIWGKNVALNTPNIDRIADEGAIYTKYYATSPVSTPSRASFMTGLYPVGTGAYINGYPLREDIMTFAKVLRDNGYATSYVGKWHLCDGDLDRWAPEQNNGFTDNKYMINCTHVPYVKVNNLPHDIELMKINAYNQCSDKENIEFLTDFLTDRTLETLERDKEKPFCIMLSIPDPHTPDIAKKSDYKEFENLDFQLPRTTTLDREYPVWASNNMDLKNNVAEGGMIASDMVNYFGMVKSIDDNVGRILDFLDSNNLSYNTIVVFTSDHGDMCFEHNRRNKGIPYEASARIPYLIRYPNVVPKGKVVETPTTNADFTPSILGLMNMPQIEAIQHGMDDSKTLVDRDKFTKNERTVMVTTYNSLWTMVTDGRHKLITSMTDLPWLLDLEKDPDEIQNFYNNPKYKEVIKNLTSEMSRQMRIYTEPVPVNGLSKEMLLKMQNLK
ncbi:MAG: sulfatase-like hydrolase/transferase [Rikenellaceae bacterium]